MSTPIYLNESNRTANPTVVVNTNNQTWKTWVLRLALAALGMSVLFNIGLFAAFREYYAKTDPPIEKFHSGKAGASDKILILKAEGTIMPPLTERLLSQIEAAGKDTQIKGVILSVDSPGGLVADSHRIYHRLLQLKEKKPIFVQMGRIAASGGYYISMGIGPKGRIYAEPTTWTGSIGVIIPRYDLSKLAGNLGIAADPLKTGEFKDALSPFRELSTNERALWTNVLNQTFDQFIEVIDVNRDTVSSDDLRNKLAKGQIFTAKDAKESGLVDEIGYLDDAIDGLKMQLGLNSARVVTYEHPTTLTDVLLGNSKAKASEHPWRMVLESTVPRALYLCSWLPPLPE